MATVAICLNCRKLWDSTKCRQVLPHMPVYLCDNCCSFLKPVAVVAEDEISNKVAAPWQQFQVASLRSYQNSPTFIPFTCAERHRLKVDEGGLHCFRCDTHLKWTYNWTLDWSWERLEPPEHGNVLAVPKPPKPQRSAEATLNQPEPPSDL